MSYVPAPYAPVPWLMRVWRHCAPDVDLRTQRNIAPLMRVYPGVPKDLSHTTLSRYENGTVPVTLELVTAFEQVLGLAPGIIGAHLEDTDVVQIDRWQRRAFLDGVDRGLDGPDWQRLSHLLTAPTGGLVLRSDDTQALIARLMTEMTVSLGPAYQFRMQALIRLAKDEFTRDLVGDAIEAHLSACGYSVIGDALELLPKAHHPRTAGVLMDSYEKLEGVALMLSAGAIEMAIIEDQISPVFWARLSEQLLADLSQPDSARYRPATLIFDLLPRPVQAHLIGRLGDSARQALTELRKAHSAVVRSPEEVRVLRARCDRIAEMLLEQTRPHRPATLTEGLIYWLREALADEHLPLEGAIVLASSPFADALSHHLERHDRDLPGAEVTLNSCQRYDASSLADAYRTAEPSDRARLLVPLAHNRAFPHDLDLRTETQAPDVEHRRLLYAAGMSAHPGLATLAQEPGLTPFERQAAGWWSRVEIPPA
ncbi:hypothetical protein ATK17_3261 [Branchiibius hedensis]|uniref:HTH cro/C1-type domain-containing protein n=1 Tax=Branchiibius hedensis TaxID=672460 RepID=A0A2Y8ZWG9_9MICO|nr:hypothetical protein [Branchiibius hedensis]PWJ27075.1 hypothetical protein ATK17_3261 [Branchiibius hedensis]SSA35886.1 hypothetical protein SAMN04489750_3261 [Branchiibius hedensis]